MELRVYCRAGLILMRGWDELYPRFYCCGSDCPMNEHGGPLLGERDGLCVIDCKRCGWAHLESMPDADALLHFYESEFWQVEKAGALEHIEDQRDWWAAIYGDWLELVRPYVPGKDLLDVGSGYGFFMDAALKHGYDVWGIEPSHKAEVYSRDRLKGRVWHGTWESFVPAHVAAPITPTRFDCISAVWLIEHLPDPLAFLRWAHEHLVSGGVLLAVVPNDFSPMQFKANAKVGKPFYWIDKTHLSYLTPESFANLLGRAGFRIVERSTLYPVEKFLMDGLDYTVNTELGAYLYGGIIDVDLKLTRVERTKRYRDHVRRNEGREIVIAAVHE